MLEKKLTRHVRAFARHLDFDLRGRKVQLSDIWVNIMPPTTAHSLHLHPLSFISGTYYVATPEGPLGSRSLEVTRAAEQVHGRAAPPAHPPPGKPNPYHLPGRRRAT